MTTRSFELLVQLSQRVGEEESGKLPPFRGDEAATVDMVPTSAGGPFGARMSGTSLTLQRTKKSLSDSFRYLDNLRREFFRVSELAAALVGTLATR